MRFRFRCYGGAALQQGATAFCQRCLRVCHATAAATKHAHAKITSSGTSHVDDGAGPSTELLVRRGGVGGAVGESVGMPVSSVAGSSTADVTRL